MPDLWAHASKVLSVPVTMAFRKWLVDEYKSLESAYTSAKSGKLHGLLTSLSPMKGNKYLKGYIADSTASMRLVGFNAIQQKELTTQPPETSSHVGELCYPVQWLVGDHRIQIKSYYLTSEILRALVLRSRNRGDSCESKQSAVFEQLPESDSYWKS